LLLFVSFSLDYFRRVCYNGSRIVEKISEFYCFFLQFLLQNILISERTYPVKKRAISLLLVAVLMLLMIPAPARGTALTAPEIKKQITETYKKAVRRFGKGSFNGYCGSLVSYQTYLLGIDSKCICYDGKDQFDRYKNLTTTTGGYRVRSYPASKYTLKQAMDAITANGTQDVYNMVVGFQKTNTAAGSIYGHALFVHAIIDGQVYFTECYDTGIGGKYYDEGSAVSCSIDTFCNYYDRWTKFDGIAYFGLKTYADVCTGYAANMTAMTVQNTQLMYEPVDIGINDADARVLKQITRGEILYVNELLRTPCGSFWYGVACGGVSGYIPVTAVETVEPTYDVSASGVRVPSSLYKGSSYVVGGTLSTTGNTLSKVIVQVYSEENGRKNEAFSVRLEVEGKSFSLNTNKIDNAMTFRKLPVGTYRIAISAEVKQYYVADGTLLSRTKLQEVWNSQFQVVSDRSRYYTVTFDAGEGFCDTDRISVAKGTAVGELPTPQRTGHRFLGWFTKKGTEPVDQEMLITGNMTLYARWESNSSDLTGWVDTENGWDYLNNGDSETGWFTYNGVRFFRYPDGSAPTGWVQINGNWYYFNLFGAAQTGWMELDNGKTYLKTDGVRAEGWTQIEDNYYYFDADGFMQTGWITLNHGKYYLGEDGVKVTGEQTIGNQVYRFWDSGLLMTGWGEENGKVIYRNENGMKVTGWQSIDEISYYFNGEGVLLLTVSCNSCNMGHVLHSLSELAGK